MLLEIVRSVGALVIGLLAVVFLRVTFDFLKDGPKKIARRRNPENYRTSMVGMSVGADGLRITSRRVYVGYPETD